LETTLMSDTPRWSTWIRLVLGIGFAGLAAVYLANSGKGGYTLTNSQFIGGLIFLACAVGSFVAFWYDRRSRT
jgi:hypothetical protein